MFMKKQWGHALFDALLSAFLWCAAALIYIASDLRSSAKTRATLAHSFASQSAIDFFERAHASHDASNHYQLDWGQQLAATDCQNQPCNDGQWASFNLAQWRQNLIQHIPQADARVSVSSTDQRMLVLQIRWPDSNATARNLGWEGLSCPEAQACVLWLGRP